VLREAGISSPPETWDNFYKDLQVVKTKLGKKGYAISIDCSTIDAMIYSFGGEIIKGKETLFDSPETIQVFSLLQQLIKEDLAYMITPGTFDDQVALAKGEIAYMIRSSSLRIGLELLEKENPFHWSIAPLPHAEHTIPVTVLFGPNITIFKTTTEQQRRAWSFVRFMTSRENTVHWAIETDMCLFRETPLRKPRPTKKYGRANLLPKVPLMFEVCKT
jgi:multiple sugar transport system substrate-binding protein